MTEVYAGVTGMAGVGAACVEWMRERDIAVFGGVCTAKIPYLSARFPTPLHKLGIVSMGLCLLDFADVEKLAEYCAEIDRWEFMVTAAPLLLAKGTGSPVNPLALF